MRAMADEGTWHELRLQVRVDQVDLYPEPQLIPWVDGSVLALGLATRADDPESGLGMDPEDVLGRHSPLMPTLGGLPYTDIGEPIPRAIVWRCSCGDDGDASIRVRVSRERDAVSGYDAVIWDDWWSHWPELGDRALPGRLRFDARAYEAEFLRLEADRWWETAPQLAARELAAVLDTRPEIIAQWRLGLVAVNGLLPAGQHEGTIGMQLRHAAGFYDVGLTCPADVDPMDAAQRIVERFRHSDPAGWDECRLLDRFGRARHAS